MREKVSGQMSGECVYSLADPLSTPLRNCANQTVRRYIHDACLTLNRELTEDRQDLRATLLRAAKLDALDRAGRASTTVSTTEGFWESFDSVVSRLKRQANSNSERIIMIIVTTAESCMDAVLCRTLQAFDQKAEKEQQACRSKESAIKRLEGQIHELEQELPSSRRASQRKKTEAEKKLATLEEIAEQAKTRFEAIGRQVGKSGGRRPS